MIKVITYPCWEKSYILLVKEAPGDNPQIAQTGI